MEQAYKINIVIGGRNYPITVQNAQEEQGVRAAALKINKLIHDFESSYAVQDKQDVLAMCALQFASFIEVNQVVQNDEKDALLEKMKEMNAKIATYLD